MSMPESVLFVHPDVTIAYSRASQRFGSLGRTSEEIRAMPLNESVPFAAIFFYTGLFYLRDYGHDQYIRELGETLINATNGEGIQLVVTEDMRETALEIGMDERMAQHVSRDEPLVVFDESPHILATLLIPTDFIEKAQTSPLEALRSTVQIGSMIRDSVNNKIGSSEDVRIRAYASEAHFLIGEAKKSPRLVFSSEGASERIQEYPFGMKSLPESARYVGVTHRARNQ